MRKRAFLALLLLLSTVLFSTVLLATILPAKGSTKNLTVDDDGSADFHTIQEAINAAVDGDTVFVKKGIYYETLVITKSILLVGDEQEKTFINANNATRNVVYINASNVSIEGFTITNNKGFPTSVTQPDGIRVEYFSNNINIKNNTISFIQYGNGISLLHSYGNSIEQNCITNCGGTGIFIEGGSGNSIKNNNVTYNGFGALLAGESCNNIIIGNLFANTTYNFGLQLDSRSSNNTVVGNTFAYNHFGLALQPPSSNTFYHNNFVHNTYQALLFGRKEDWVGLANYWDNGKEGNYWSDYNGLEIDQSGIGNTPYAIIANWDSNVVYLDNYPLISPFNASTTFPSPSPIPTPTPSQTPTPTNPPTPTLNSTSTPTPTPIPVPGQSFFTVESNSTISELFFNSTSSELSFTVNGTSGTTGYVKVTIAKSLVTNAENIKVYLDENQLNVPITEDADSWLLSFTYMHSTHQVMISLATNEPEETFLSNDLILIAVAIVLAAAVISMSLLLFLKKRKR